MSDLEKEVLDQEEVTQDIEEAKASFGVDAEVPDPQTKETDAPGDKGKDADKEKKAAPKTSSTQVPKTKVALMSSMQQHLASMNKADLTAAYNKMMGEEVEEEETSAKSIKEIKQISAADVDVAEDVQAMFSGEELSEDFTSKATTIFEAAVVAKVNSILEETVVDLEAELEAEKEEIVESLSNRLDDYMEYVVEEWMKENELAVEQGIKAEITENFMVGLRNLFTESYIDIPEEKVDLVDELANKVSELEASINEEVEKNIAVRKELAESQKEVVLRDVCDGLTESQAVKIKSLAEGVDFDTRADYAEKLETLKENYFPQEEVLTEDTSVDDEPVELEEETEVQVAPEMQAYMDAISRSIKK
jgi:hypothetical protein